MREPAETPAPPAGLHPTTWMVLRALRSGARLSRNRNFYLFQDPRARRAIQLHRYLESIIRDVRAHGQDVEVRRVAGVDGTAGAFALRVDFPLLHGHRTCYLSELELTLLAEQAPAVGRLLERRLDDDADPGPAPRSEREAG